MTGSPGFAPGTVILQDGAVDVAHPPRWLVLLDPVGVVTCDDASQVEAALRELRSQVARGRTAAGFLAYEAAPAFDRALSIRPCALSPVLWFGLYRRGELRRGLPRLPAGPFRCGPWTPEVTPSVYAEAVTRIRGLIAAGETYQVNLSQRLMAPWSGDPWGLFRQLCHRQRTRHAAFVHAGDQIVCSASPELFFALDGARVCCRPMKGTAPRAHDPEADAAAAEALVRSAKDRAENVMIVDMLRNDLGHVARYGSVRTGPLCAIEAYPTVWQMVSTVTAATAADPVEILAALFPCASVTGAPKVAAMKFIAEIETSPRGIYTGCVGYWAPGRRAAFNVAIRTVVVDPVAGTARYGVGGGVVWDSTPGGEVAECGWKAALLGHPDTSFSRTTPDPTVSGDRPRV